MERTGSRRLLSSHMLAARREQAGVHRRLHARYIVTEDPERTETLRRAP